MPIMTDRNELWKKVVKELFEGKQKALEDTPEFKILKGIDEIKEKMDKQEEVLIKLSVLLSKMYADGEINKDTFNKLDIFLKPYYENQNDVDY